MDAGMVTVNYLEYLCGTGRINQEKAGIDLTFELRFRIQLRYKSRKGIGKELKWLSEFVSFLMISDGIYII